MAIPEADVALIGAGFGTIVLLQRLRKEGFTCKVFEKGQKSGGIWYWNCYPGARVDSDAPIYQVFDREVYNDFEFTERYPGQAELKRYFEYLDHKLDLNKDTEYGKNLVAATFDETERKWTAEFEDGSKFKSRWLIPSVGFAAKAYLPDWKNRDLYQGELYHTGLWPQHGASLKNKRIAVIGTGASGIQVTQEVGNEASEFTLYQRTPNYCCPMNQRTFEPGEMARWKADGKFDDIFLSTEDTFAGFAYDFVGRNTFDDSPEERRRFYHQKLVEEGGFGYWLNTYNDLFFDEAANTEAYNFWRDTVRARITDPAKHEVMAPEKPIHPWGVKRPSLEQHFYETISQPNCTIVNTADDPIVELTATGIKTASGEHREFDMIILATGFDAVTGSLKQIAIRSPNTNQTIQERWADGLRTSMGVAMAHYPNLYFLYGPQAPTAFSNGPSCVQFQAKWLAQHLARAKAAGVTRIEATEQREADWTRRVAEVWEATLFPKATGWYSGGNVPGKRVEPLNWAGGMKAYVAALYEGDGVFARAWKVD